MLTAVRQRNDDILLKYDLRRRDGGYQKRHDPPFKYQYFTSIKLIQKDASDNGKFMLCSFCELNREQGRNKNSFMEGNYESYWYF